MPKFSLPPQGPWWQYVAPMFPSRAEHAAARVVQSQAREFLCRRWVQCARMNAAGVCIAAACSSWYTRVRRRRQIEESVRMHVAKQAYDSRMSTLRSKRLQEFAPPKRADLREMASRCTMVSKHNTSMLCKKNTVFRGAFHATSPKGKNKRISVQPGSCVLMISCPDIETCVGKGNDLVLVVKPSKLRVGKLHEDLQCGIRPGFTLSINGLLLEPHLFRKKLNCVGICPGGVYRVIVHFA